MKKIIFLIILILIVYLLLNNKSCQNKLAKKYLINNKNYCLLTADTQDEWERGLMFYKKPVDFDGMIFIFPEKQTKSFWNKNTFMDLDLYWMDGGKVVGKSLLPSIKNGKEVVIVESKVKVDRVVEIIIF